MIFRRLPRVESSALAGTGRLVALLIGLVVLWYGLAGLLLAFKVDPDAVDAISGYRLAVDAAGALRAEDGSALARALGAGLGLFVFASALFLAWALVPRRVRGRRELPLDGGADGRLHLRPRAVERVAETATRRALGGAETDGRYEGDRLTIRVAITRRNGDGLASELERARRAAREALGTHGLPVVPIDLELISLYPTRRM